MIFIMLGRAQCEVLSCVDLEEAFHSLPLTPAAKEFCGILPYFGSSHFRYEVLPMGLAISPQFWSNYIANILCGMANKQDYIVIMDDLLVHGLKGNHLDRLKALFKAMIKHGLKLSPPRTCKTCRPPRPPRPTPDGADLLAQMVAAMQAIAAGLPGPGDRAPPPPSRVKIPPPIFKGLPGERPEAHLLRTNDWMDTYNIPVVDKPANFKHTLDHLAREWYDSLTFPIGWNDFLLIFL